MTEKEKQETIEVSNAIQKKDPSPHFCKLPNTIPQTHAKNLYRKGKKYVQVKNSILLSNP